jgi:hypothetical protein
MYIQNAVLLIAKGGGTYISNWALKRSCEVSVRSADERKLFTL